MSEPDLQALYTQALYVADLPEGRVIFRVGSAAQGLAPARSLTIITAYNPGHERPGAAANATANRSLAAALEVRGYRFWPAEGRSPDGVHVEPSFAVPDLTPAEALAIAARFRQAAVLYWDGAAARLLWTPQDD